MHLLKQLGNLGANGFSRKLTIGGCFFQVSRVALLLEVPICLCIHPLFLQKLSLGNLKLRKHFRCKSTCIYVYIFFFLHIKQRIITDLKFALPIGAKVKPVLLLLYI